jgi:hypothetical protein
VFYCIFKSILPIVDLQTIFNICFIGMFVIYLCTKFQMPSSSGLVEKPEGKRPLGRPRRRWVDNNKMDLRERGWGGMDWIDVAQYRDRWRALVNTVMNLRVPYNAGNVSSSCTIGGFSRRAQLHEWVSELQSSPSNRKLKTICSRLSYCYFTLYKELLSRVGWYAWRK